MSWIPTGPYPASDLVGEQKPANAAAPADKGKAAAPADKGKAAAASVKGKEDSEDKKVAVEVSLIFFLFPFSFFLFPFSFSFLSLLQNDYNHLRM